MADKEFVLRSTDISSWSNCFIHLNKCFERLGFTNSGKITIFKILSSILNVGNIRFEKNGDAGDDGSSIESSSQGFLCTVANLLNVNVLELGSAFTCRIVEVANQSIQ